MNLFSILDLPERAGELACHVEAGRLSLVTLDGKPLFLAVPFDETLLRHGLLEALAARLFERQIVSLEQAARLAEMPVAKFIDLLAALRIPVTCHPPAYHGLDSDALY